MQHGQLYSLHLLFLVFVLNEQINNFCMHAISTGNVQITKMRKVFFFQLISILPIGGGGCFLSRVR